MGLAAAFAFAAAPGFGTGFLAPASGVFLAAPALAPAAGLAAGPVERRGEAVLAASGFFVAEAADVGRFPPAGAVPGRFGAASFASLAPGLAESFAAALEVAAGGADLRGVAAGSLAEAGRAEAGAAEAGFLAPAAAFLAAAAAAMSAG